MDESFVQNRHNMHIESESIPTNAAILVPQQQQVSELNQACNLAKMPPNAVRMGDLVYVPVYKVQTKNESANKNDTSFLSNNHASLVNHKHEVVSPPPPNISTDAPLDLSIKSRAVETNPMKELQLVSASDKLKSFFLAQKCDTQRKFNEFAVLAENYYNLNKNMFPHSSKILSNLNYIENGQALGESKLFSKNKAFEYQELLHGDVAAAAVASQILKNNINSKSDMLIRNASSSVSKQQQGVFGENDFYASKANSLVGFQQHPSFRLASSPLGKA